MPWLAPMYGSALDAALAMAAALAITAYWALMLNCVQAPASGNIACWNNPVHGRERFLEGLLPETTLLNPQTLLVQATLIVCEHEQVMKPMRQFDASDKLRTAQMHLFGAINKSQEVMGPWNGKWHAGTYSEKNFARTVGPSNSHLRKLVT